MLTFPLPFQGQATGILSATASAWDVETALEALAEIDNVIVTGDSGGPWTVEFVGAQAGTNVARFDGDAARLTSGTLAREISYSWDIGTRLVAASDPDSSYTLAYDDLDRLVSIDNQGTPNIPRVVLNSSYDASGNRTRLAAVIDGTDDFVNDYTYDLLNRMTRVDQYGVAGGHAVAEKRVDMAYNSLGQFTQIVRYSALSGTPSDEVATSVYTYDAAHRLVGLSHNRGGQPLFTPYSWTYDPLDRITQMVNSDGTSVFTYDQTDQLTGADHSYQTDEAYQYDANGNRTGSGYVTGSNNQLLEDGTYRYEYDAEGNRTAKETIATGEREEYTWDHRNRLVRFLRKDAQGAIVLDVHYSYDVFDRRIGKTVDPDGDGAQGPSFTWFVYDNPSVVTGAADPALVGADHIVLEFTGSQPATLKYRYLHGPVVDQVFAREDVESLWRPGEVLWALGDHLGTVRDLIDTSGNVVNHIRYEAFGRITSETNAAVDFLFAFTGRERDEESGLFYYRARYYDPAVGRFISEDPLGFAAGDRNLARYVGNIPIVALDPSGLQSPQESPSIRVIRQPLDPTDRFPIRWRIGVDRPADRPIGVVQRMRFDYRILLPGGDLQQGTQDYFELIGIIVPPDDTVTIIGHPNITKSWYNQIAITDDYYNPDRARRLLDRTYRRYTTDFIFASQLPDQRYHDIYMYNPPAGSTGWVTFRGELRLYEANEPFMRIVQTWDDAPAVKSPLLRSGQLPAAHIDPSRRVAYEYRNFMDAFWNTPNAHLGRDVKTVRAEWDRDGQVTVEQ